MGCHTSICSESELMMTQELNRDLKDKSNNFYHTETTERFLDVKNTLSGLLNFNKKLVEIAIEWLNEINLWVNQNGIMIEDIKNSISVSFDSKQICIKHEFNTSQSFTPIYSFAKRNFKDFNESKFVECEKNLLNLSPLSIIFYLKLGEIVDCGIGIEKPLDTKQVSNFLSFSAEKQSIFLWSGSLIPTALYYSVLSSTRTVQFYIFDGHKAQNYLKGISLFEFFGAPLDKSVKDEVMKFKNEAVTASIDLEEHRITSMSLFLHNTSNSKSLMSALQLPISSESHKFTNGLTSDKICLSLSANGFEIHEVYSLSHMLIPN